MLMDSCMGVRRDAKSGSMTIQCSIDGAAQELTVPANVLARFAWASWAEHATPSNIHREAMTIPVQTIGTGVSEDAFVLLLHLAGGWDIHLMLQSHHVEPMRQVVQQLQLRFSVAGSA